MIKIFFTVAGLMLACSLVLCQTNLTPNYSAQKGLYGYTDGGGKLIIKHSYQEAKDFINGVAIVKKRDKYGMINTEGKEIIKCKYTYFYVVPKSDSLLSFCGNERENSGLWNKYGKQLYPCEYKRFLVKQDVLILNKGLLYGIGDTLGNILFPVRLENEPYFVEGIAKAAVREDGYQHWGYITKKGDVLIPFKFLETRDFKQNLVVTEYASKFQIFNNLGKKVVDADFEDANDLHRPIPVKLNGKWGIVGENGYIMPCEYDSQFNFSEPVKGTIKIVKNNKYGLIDNTGKILVPCKYENINQAIINGRFVYWKNKKMGIDNVNGETIIPPEYDMVTDLWNLNMILVKKDNKYGVYNISGKIICPLISNTEPKYEAAEKLLLGNNETGAFIFDFNGNLVAKIEGATEINQFQNGLAKITIENLSGFVNNKGIVVIPCKYNSIEAFSSPDYLARAERNKQWGLVSQKGEEIIPCVYEYVFELSDGLICAEKDGKWGYINIKNEIVIPFKYSKAYSFSDGEAEIVDGTEFHGKIDKNEKRISENYFDKVVPASNPDFPTFIDPRDNTAYKTIKVGKLIWFDQNLNYKPKTHSYDNNEENSNYYGGLYSYTEAPKACPAGWRLPTDSEWKYMNQYTFHPQYGGLFNANYGYKYLLESGAWWQDMGNNILDGVYTNHDSGMELKSDFDITYMKNYCLSIRCVKSSSK